MDNHKPLFHYCNLETFLSIVKNKTIRLTDIQKSNDRLETKALFDYVLKKAVSVLEESVYGQLIEGVENEVAIKHFVEFELNRIKNEQDILMYVACFSEKGDLLSQWRGYADNGRGVSIGFRPEKLRNLNNSMLKLGKVHYVNVDKENTQMPEEAEEYADILCDKIAFLVNNRRIGDFLEGERVPVYSLFDPQIFRESIFYKHHGFEEEQEWRLVLNDELNKIDNWNELYNWERDKDKAGFCQVVPSALQFRSVGDDIVSYMDVLFHNDAEDICEAISTIITGPNCKLQYADLYQILSHYNFDPNPLDIHKSESSYMA